MAISFTASAQPNPPPSPRDAQPPYYVSHPPPFVSSSSVDSGEAASGSRQTIILEHQRPAFEKLLQIGRACFSMQRTTLPFAPRTSTMIVAPTGVGKSFLALAVARSLNAKSLHITATDWVPQGCSGRGAENTWRVLFQFLEQNHSADGLVIFLDEIDKLSGNASWDTYVRNEAFQLLDLRIPEGLIKDNDERPCKSAMKRAQEALTNRTFIIGAGAFQQIWDAKSRPNLGFAETETPPPDLTQLATIIPRELSNRFRSELIILPQLGESDYRRMLNEAASLIPPYLRATFVHLGAERIGKALRCHQGCRFIEELLLDTIILEREAIRTNVPPTPAPRAASPHEPGN